MRYVAATPRRLAVVCLGISDEGVAAAFGDETSPPRCQWSTARDFKSASDHASADGCVVLAGPHADHVAEMQRVGAVADGTRDDVAALGIARAAELIQAGRAEIVHPSLSAAEELLKRASRTVSPLGSGANCASSAVANASPNMGRASMMSCGSASGPKRDWASALRAAVFVAVALLGFATRPVAPKAAVRGLRLSPCGVPCKMPDHLR